MNDYKSCFLICWATHCSIGDTEYVILTQWRHILSNFVYCLRLLYIFNKIQKVKFEKWRILYLLKRILFYVMNNENSQ